MAKQSFKTRLITFFRSYAQHNEALQDFILEAGQTYLATNNGQDLGMILDQCKNLQKVKFEGLRAYVSACIVGGSIGKGKGNKEGETITVIKSKDKEPQFAPPVDEQGNVVAWYAYEKAKVAKPEKSGYKKLEEYVGKLEGINDTTKLFLLEMLSSNTLDTRAKAWWEDRKAGEKVIAQVEKVQAKHNNAKRTTTPAPAPATVESIAAYEI